MNYEDRDTYGMYKGNTSGGPGPDVRRGPGPDLGKSFSWCFGAP